MYVYYTRDVILFHSTGPALSGSLVQGIGFEKMLIGIAIICFLYGPLLCALKDVPPRTDQEKQETSVSTLIILNSEKVVNAFNKSKYGFEILFRFIAATNGRWL